MKQTLNMLLALLLVTFGCSIANAQIIYSNNFLIGSSVNITDLPPTVANSYAGGTNTAVWWDTLGTGDTADLQDNGIDTTTASTSWVLPFSPTNGYVYLLTATVSFTNNPNNWVGAGFAQVYTQTEPVGNGRYSDAVAGIDWEIITEGTGNVQAFGGAKAANPVFSGNNFFPPGPGTNTMSLLLDTEGSNWVMAAYVNGNQAGTNFTYAAHPLIASAGITQTAVTAPTTVQWQNFTLVTTYAPYISQQPTPASIIVGGGSRYTNIVKVLADTNVIAGPLSYQWYANGFPLTNGVNNVSGANTNLLVINPISSLNMFTNYYVIVTNLYGSATSSFASVTVLTNPIPTTVGGPINLFAGSGGNVGSSPQFSMVAVGAPPISYYWLTNGVAVGGATNASLAFTNCTASSPATYTCTVSNSFSATNITWTATYLATPTAAYPQAVLGDMPLNFWRLNELDNGSGDDGSNCSDYASGDNGVYTNVLLQQTGYNSAEMSEPSMYVTAAGAQPQPQCVKLVKNSDLAVTFTNGTSATFAVEAWANCLSGNGGTGGAPVVSQGLFQSSTFFLGVDTNSTKRYQFYVRSAAGTLYSADDTNAADSAPDLNWHHLVGVCDQVHGVIQLYIDGILAAQTAIPSGAGLFESGMPVAIGAGERVGAADYNVPFTGNISDVAIYSHALSIGSVVAHYSAVYSTIPLTFATPVPGTNFSYLANQTLTIPMTVAGSSPIGYYWTNLTTATLISSGGTNSSGSLNVSLSIPNASSSLSGDQIELVVTNPVSSTNVTFVLFNPAPPVALDYSSSILYSNYFNGGNWSIGNMPLTVDNLLVGGTNTVWADILGTNDPGILQANGVDATAAPDSWVVPFTPHPGYVYTITASLTWYGNPSSWVGLGFAHNYVNTNAASGHGRFSDDVASGYDWIILSEATTNIQYFAGSGGNGGIANKNNFYSPNTGTHTVQVLLDTTTNNWKASAYVDSVLAGTTNYASTNLPAIGAVGITQTTLTSASTNVQWNYWALTQVAPAGGAAPYPMSSLPASVTLLAGSALSFNENVFGQPNFGYSWINTNTAAVLGSGTSSTLAPLTANLSVASVPISWNGNVVALVMTNSYGTNISYVTVVVTNAVIIPTNKPAITGFNIAGANVSIAATNGQTGGTYYLLGTTNLTTPVGQWLPVATNVITTNGSATFGFTFTGTNVFNTSKPQQFYILSNTN
ncbi:MAG TPA: LamG domain-containing protein [Candidatus Sulfotelmatobacter sp.]|jgi:hypothetical protein|nr:LamG domain-containing protein [Candidatus Sulfotelmatobacter sp.]